MKKKWIELLDRVIIICSVVFLVISYEPIVKVMESGKDYQKVKETDLDLKYLTVEFSKIYNYEIENGKYRIGILTNDKKVIIVNEFLADLPETNFRTGALFMNNIQARNKVIAQFEEVGIQVGDMEEYVVIIADNPYKINLLVGTIFILGIAGLLYEIAKKILKRR